MPQLYAGGDDFREFRIESQVFVDKSLLIKELIEIGETAMLITRPRRWGKSLNLDMLHKFFALVVDPITGVSVEPNPHRVLFEGGMIENVLEEQVTLKPLKIAQSSGKNYMKHQGRYPVIYLSLKNVTGDSRVEVEAGLKNVISSLFLQHQYLGLNLQYAAKTNFEKILYGGDHLDITTLKDSLLVLSQLLHTYHNMPVYILIDEYDKPVMSLLTQSQSLTGQSKAFWREEVQQVARLMEKFFSAGGTDNPALKQIVLTGVLNALTKEGNSGFNNVRLCSIDQPEFSTCFGFSDVEIQQQLLSPMQLAQPVETLNKIRSWYNGYRVPQFFTDQRLSVYTPWSVMQYCGSVSRGSQQGPQNYWTQSGVNWTLQNMTLSEETFLKMTHLANGQVVALENPSESLIMLWGASVGKLAEEALVSYCLLHSGYLTLADDGKYQIPNQEVLIQFHRQLLRQWKKELTKFGSLNSLLPVLHEALEDAEQFKITVQKGLLENMPTDERTEAYFQSLIGSAIELYAIEHPKSARYQVLVEKSVSNTGRIDNLFYPTKTALMAKVVVHEYKRLLQSQTDLIERSLIEGLAHIIQKRYWAEPLDKKKWHPQQHEHWNRLEMRSLVFFQDENTGKWNLQIDSRTLTIKQAEHILPTLADAHDEASLVIDTLDRLLAATID